MWDDPLPPYAADDNGEFGDILVRWSVPREVIYGDAGRFSHARLQVFLRVAERNHVGDGLVGCREVAQDGAEVFSCFLNFLCGLLSDSILAKITRLLSFGQKLPADDAV